ncbi:hypothetical protein U9M48_032361 [Paspalum notatum var. saurae]|uniref:Uncharacterized protein n=1 Tax=Paspalum notatum var. saurae TaxID=547442 RepID=A0AAQ3U7L9_PASNO
MVDNDHSRIGQAMKPQRTNSSCWKSRVVMGFVAGNDIVSDKSQQKSFLGTHWLRLWAKLQRNEDQAQVIVQGCRHLETVALQVFFRGTHWLRLWAKLQRNEDQAQVIVQGCRHLETVALQRI